MPWRVISGSAIRSFSAVLLIADSVELFCCVKDQTSLLNVGETFRIPYLTVDSMGNLALFSLAITGSLALETGSRISPLLAPLELVVPILAEIPYALEKPFGLRIFPSQRACNIDQFAPF